MSSFVADPIIIYGLNQIHVPVNLIGTDTTWQTEEDETFSIVSGPAGVRIDATEEIDDTHVTFLLNTGGATGLIVLSDGVSQFTILLEAVEPTGPISLALANLRFLVASSTAMQSWMGVSDVASAMQRVYLVSEPPPADGKEYTLAEIEARRPFAIADLFDPIKGMAMRAGTESFVSDKRADGMYEENGLLALSLEADAGEGLGSGDAKVDFMNKVGAVIEDMQALSGTDGYLNIHKIRIMVAPVRSDQGQLQTMGDYFKTVLLVEHGI